MDVTNFEGFRAPVFSSVKYYDQSPVLNNKPVEFQRIMSFKTK